MLFVMHSTATSKNHLALRVSCRNPWRGPAVGAAARRAMHEIKRSILKKLWLRMNREAHA
jgi:hypothetical protein